MSREDVLQRIIETAHDVIVDTEESNAPDRKKLDAYICGISAIMGLAKGALLQDKPEGPK